MKINRTLNVGLLSLALAGCVFALHVSAAEPVKAGRDSSPYNYRDTPAYKALTDDEKTKLDAVRRNFATLSGPLDRFADFHGGHTPRSLSELVPDYLPELPVDPFATNESAAEQLQHDPHAPLQGLGYGYRPGAGENRIWCLSSAGLSEFPFLTDQGNIGLYVCKGIWLSGKNVYDK